MTSRFAQVEGEVDFTSALYLGMRHGSRDLRPWRSLTRGVPATLVEPSGAVAVARRLAELQGCEAATLLPSTLHLFWDLFGVLAGETSGVWVDSGAYPIARWGAERARGMGVPVRIFPHRHPAVLGRMLGRTARRPVVVADGFCPGCGRAAPLAEYLEVVRRSGGWLIVDDTQALGIFGRSPGPAKPYGTGGGGSLQRLGISEPDVLLGSSLAKAFGAPIAVLSGAAEMIRRFEQQSQTRLHCSPPAVPVVYAAARALKINHQRGDALRKKLAVCVRRFHNGLAELGMKIVGGWFPVQTLRPATGIDAAALHARLLAMGIRTVLHSARNASEPLVSFIINVTHTPDEIERAVAAVADATRPMPTRSRPCDTHLTHRDSAPAARPSTVPVRSGRPTTSTRSMPTAAT